MAQLPALLCDPLYLDLYPPISGNLPPLSPLADDCTAHTFYTFNVKSGRRWEGVFLLPHNQSDSLLDMCLHLGPLSSRSHERIVPLQVKACPSPGRPYHAFLPALGLCIFSYSSLSFLSLFPIETSAIGARGGLSWLSVRLSIWAQIMISWFVGSSPLLGSALTAYGTYLGFSLSLCLFPSLPPLPK